MKPLPRPTLLVRLSGLFLLGPALLPAAARAADTKGDFEIQVIDKDTKQPIAVRMHLKDPRGRPVRPPRLPYWQDHFVFFGKLVLNLRPGHYTFEIERGPEYRPHIGHFDIRRGATDNTTVEMVRFVDMMREGWWSGDLHVHRPLDEIPLLMQAEDLHVAPVITWWNETNLWSKTTPPADRVTQFDGPRFYDCLAGEDERGGGALLYFNLDQPLPLVGAQREFPPAVRFLETAAQTPAAHVDIEKPFWWDMPIWVATGHVHSIGIAHNHMHRGGVLDGEAWGKPRDTMRYPGPQGNGRWTQDLYYQLLDCGLRLPPSAGSASGVLPNPVGYNRVYVHCDGELTYAKWFEGLRAGRVMVTNGPLLRPRFNGELPGHVFQADAGSSIEVQVQLNLSLRDKVDYLEIIRDGRVVQEVRLEEYKQRRGQLQPVTFRESGWLLVRAVTNHADTFRFASSGPVYVEIGYQPRISRAATQFFADWIEERAQNLQLDDSTQRAEVLATIDAARTFWTKRRAAANAD